MYSVEKKIANNFIALRKSLGMRQVEFAKSIKITNSYISSIERGKSKNISDQIFNSIELIYGIKQRILLNGTPGDVKKAVKNRKAYADLNEVDARVAQKKTDYSQHGGWTPQTEASDWGCLPKVVEIIESDTIYSKALLQNIDAFYHAIKAGKDRRKGDRRKQDHEYGGEDRRMGERRKKTASGE